MFGGLAFLVDGLRTTRRLAAWVARGVRCAKGLPPR